MAGYGNAVDIKTLLAAMRDQALADETDLEYLRRCDVIPHLLLAEFMSGPAIYLIARGSPADVVAEGVGTQARRAVHRVQVVPGIFIQSPYEEDPILGTGNQMGILEHTQNVLSFYAGNLLGLSGLDEQNRPKIEATENAYQTLQVDDEDTQGWLIFSTLDYRARTAVYDDTTR